MDPIISLGQKNTLAEYMILFGADNHPPMLDNDLYDSWKSRMELYMQDKDHGRMILESSENDPLIWLTVEENGVTRTKKYAELFGVKKIQADSNMKATNIILQNLPADIYSLVNHHKTEDLDTYDSDCDDVSNAKLVLMANIFNYGSDVILEVPHSETYLNDMENQIVKKMINSQIDDIIKEKLALKEQVDSLEQNLSNQIKEKECLLQTFTVFQSESKEKEDKYIENDDLEKKIKELDNILFKVGQSAHTVHMLTKPQAFYDNIHKQALGYQNPFYLKKAQRIKPTLYDGIVISNKHVAMHVIDEEETLILEEVSRSKMSKKEKDPEAIKQKISNKPIDYVKLNKLYKDFRKRFGPQQELLADEAFWYHMLYPSTKSSVALLVKIEAPKELPKVSLVNESLKKLKLHLANFDKVVKMRTTPNTQTEGEWGLNILKLFLTMKLFYF
uniref:Uncharacterized protein n=1 Tax=Tanacetum cinerariifolium TaxID=118510 RepID=A0A699HR58_TANCI|nr:hypothetical protein [Tanacetum cinerariifolium]